MLILINRKDSQKQTWSGYYNELKKAQAILKENGLGEFEIVDDYKSAIKSELDVRLQNIESRKVCKLSDEEYEKLLETIAEELYQRDETVFDEEYLIDTISSFITFKS